VFKNFRKLAIFPKFWKSEGKNFGNRKSENRNSYRPILKRYYLDTKHSVVHF